MRLSQDQVTLVNVLECATAVGELAVVETSPTAQLMVTAGSDAIVRVWDLKTHRVLKRTQLFNACTAGCTSPNGQSFSTVLAIVLALSCRFPLQKCLLRVVVCMAQLVYPTSVCTGSTPSLYLNCFAVHTQVSL